MPHVPPQVLLPVLVNALLAILSSRASSSTRLKIIALSTVAAAAMLNPSFLGLPQGVDGIPFVMALVIGHLGITFCMLLATGFIVEKHFAIIEKTREFKKMRRPMLVTEWKGAFALKEEIESQLYGWASANMEENKDSSMKVEGIDAVEIVTGGDRNKKESESDVGTMPPTSPPLSPSAQTQARITSPRPDSKYSESTLVAKMRTKKGLRYGRKPEAALLSDARWSQSQQSECRQRRLAPEVSHARSCDFPTASDTSFGRPTPSCTQRMAPPAWTGGRQAPWGWPHRYLVMHMGLLF